MRSPPDVAANQISPRCIAPVRPILRRTPIDNGFQRTLCLSRRLLLPPLRIRLTVQHDQMPMQRIAEKLGAINSKGVRPPLHPGGP
jgi:hypothetical protein